MPRQLERLLALDHLLRSQPRPTASRLAELLERSERTIRSDLAFLRDRYHAPLECSKSKGYHYTNAEWVCRVFP
ncbi:MAG TPA: helix-turn-helix domain-containing protein [Thermosynechococcaceae cyanobacterium]